MAVIVPDYSAELRESLSQLGQGLGQLINPHGKDRRAFEKAAAQNPEILQHMRDLAEIQGPGTYEALKDFVPKHLMQVITNLQPSAEAKIAVGGRAAVGAMTPDQQASLGLSKITGMKPTEAAVETAVAPLVSGTAAELPGEVGGTAAERGAYRALTGGETPEEAGQGILKGQMVQQAGEFLSQLPPERLKQIGAYAAVPNLMADDHFQQQLALQREMFRARKGDRVSELMLRLQEQNAIWWQQKSGTGTSPAWSNYLFGDGRERVEKLHKGDVKNITGEDLELLEIDKAFRAAPAEMRALDLNRADVGITKMIQNIGKADDPSIRAPMLVALNQQLSNRAAITGTPRITARWETSETARKLQAQGGISSALGSALGQFKKLRFYDAHNKEIDDRAIGAMLESPVDIPAATPGAPAAGAPNVGAPVKPGKTKAERWNEVRVQMFPHIPAGKLTSAQVNAVKSRVDSEMPE